jgi:hypothetical protein
VFGIKPREIILVTLGVVLLFGGVVGGLSLPRPYKDTLMVVSYAATLLVVGFLIIGWFIRRRRRD